MVQSFEIVGNGHEKPAMQKLILDIKASIEGGSTLHESLAKFPLYFDDLFVNLVEAGEQAGALETLLDKIATYKEKTEALKKKIKKALFYPAAGYDRCCGGDDHFADLRDSAVRRIVQRVSARICRHSPKWSSTCPASFSTKVGGWASWLSAPASGSCIFYKRSRNMQRGLDRVMLKFPIIGPILQKSAIARFSRTLSTMFAAGVPLVEAMGSVAGATGNIVYEEATLAHEGRGRDRPTFAKGHGQRGLVSQHGRANDRGRRGIGFARYDVGERSPNSMRQKSTTRSTACRACWSL
jgi:type IV pilus assembly protein PilC